MRNWKPAALSGALVLAMAAAVVTAVVHGQSPEREPFIRAFELIGRGAQIGVQVRDVGSDDSKAPPSGVIVDEVQADRPATRSSSSMANACEAPSNSADSCRKRPSVGRSRPCSREMASTSRYRSRRSDRLALYGVTTWAPSVGTMAHDRGPTACRRHRRLHQVQPPRRLRVLRAHRQWRFRRCRDSTSKCSAGADASACRLKA